MFAGSFSEIAIPNARALALQRGCKIASRITSDLNYLVAGSHAEDQVLKAKTLKTINIITEIEFLKMMKNKPAVSDKTVKKTPNVKKPAAKDGTSGVSVNEPSAEDVKGTDLTSFFINMFGTDDMKKEYQENDDSTSAKRRETGLQEEERFEDKMEKILGKHMYPLYQQIEEEGIRCVVVTCVLYRIIMREAGDDADHNYNKLTSGIIQNYAMTEPSWSVMKQRDEKKRANALRSLINTIREGSKKVADDFLELLSDEPGAIAVKYRLFYKSLGIAGMASSGMGDSGELGDITGNLLGLRDVYQLANHPAATEVDATINDIIRDQMETAHLISHYEAFAESFGQYFAKEMKI